MEAQASLHLVGGAVRPTPTEKTDNMTKPLKARKTRMAKVAAGVAAMVLAFAVHAQARNFNIPAGDLKSALDAYVAATGQQIVYKRDDLKGRTSKGVQGAMTPEQALERLLEGTNLKLRRDSSGAVVVFSDESNAGGASGSQPAVVNIPPVLVEGKALSHLADMNRTGTRIDTDPMTLPMSVSTIDKELLVQQQALNLRDAVSNVAGVSDLGVGGIYTMRGFAAGMMRNGNLLISGLNPDVPISAISRIEVVKGPEAIIAGVTSGYGGVINVITKTPQATPVTEVTATAGSRSFYEVGADLGRPLNADKSLLGRIVVSKQGAGSTMVGYAGDSTDYIAPSLTWRNRPTGTEITGQYEYQDKRTAPAAEVYTNKPSLDAGLQPVRLGAPGDGTRVISKVATLALTQRITDEWRLEGKYTDDRRASDGQLPLSSPGAAFGFPFPSVITFGERVDLGYNTKTAKVELKGDFDTGPVSHKALFAYDNARSTITSAAQYLSIKATDVSTGQVTDLGAIFGPAFGGLPSPVFSGGGRLKETGGVALDQMTWGDWVALVGFRYIRFHSEQQGAPDLDFNRSLPSLGLLYRVTPTLSLYGSASKGFTPNAGNFTTAGSMTPPENAQQFEVGGKSLMLDGRLAATLSLYSIKQNNVAVPDPLHPNGGCLGNGCYISVPGVRSRGAELEVSGQVTSHLGIRANYSFNAKSADSPNELGVYWPRHEASLWTTYRFAGEESIGWWVGAGVRARSARMGGSPTDAANPGQVRVDLSAGYDAKAWSFIAGVKNVADKRLYPIFGGVFGTATIDQPREFYVTGRYKFD
jgi:iron complex outermembrane receptor protein